MSESENRPSSRLFSGLIVSLHPSRISYLSISYVRSIGATGISYEVQVSAGLPFGEDLGSVEIGTEDLGNGLERVTVRSAAGIGEHGSQFARLVVTQVTP